MTISSRMVYAFARDGGLPASGLHALVHLGMPLNTLYLTTSVTLLFGCIFAISSAFNAISSASVVALSIPRLTNCDLLSPRARQVIGRYLYSPSCRYLVRQSDRSLLLDTNQHPVSAASEETSQQHEHELWRDGASPCAHDLRHDVDFHGRESYRGPSLLQYDSIPRSDSLETST
jgi:hypothetical protein